jgi:cytochrome c oxidase cbb3-type subunit 1
MADRGVNEVVHFTHAIVAHSHHGLYAFFTMVMFGSIYYILPRILHREWPSAKLISLHFWTTAIGSLAMVLILSIVGTKQGLAMNNANIPFLSMEQTDVVRSTIEGLRWRSYTGILITIGHLAFAINFVWMIFKPRVENSAPTLFRNPDPDLEVSAR